MVDKNKHNLELKIGFEIKYSPKSSANIRKMQKISKRRHTLFQNY